MTPHINGTQIDFHEPHFFTIQSRTNADVTNRKINETVYICLLNLRVLDCADKDQGP